MRSKDKGPLKKKIKDKKTTVKTTRLSLICPPAITRSGEYLKKDGTKGYCGSEALKGTQPLGSRAVDLSGFCG